MARNTLELFIKAKDQASPELKKVEKSTGRLKKTIKQVGDVSLGMAKAVTAAATAFAAVSAKEFVSFDKSMREVNTLLGVSQKEFQNLTDDTHKLATSLGIDANEAAKALYQTISAGIPQENALSFLEIASKAAIGGVTDTETAVDGLTTVLNAFKIPASETKKVADAMFQTVKLGKTDFGNLSRSMFNAAPIAASLGLNFQDVLGATATLTKQGTPTSVAMTQIRAALTALSAPGEELSSVFRQLNVKGFDELLKKKGSLQGVFGALRDATGGNTKQLQKMFGSVEAVSAVLGTTGKNAEMAAEDLDKVHNSAGAATEAFDEMEKATDRGFREITALMDAIGKKISQKLGPMFEFLAKKAREFREAIETPTELDIFRRTLKNQGLQDLQAQLKGTNERLQEFIDKRDPKGKLEAEERIRLLKKEIALRKKQAEEKKKLDDKAKEDDKKKTETKKKQIEEEIDLEMDADDMVIALMNSDAVKFDEHLQKKKEKRAAAREEQRAAEEEFEAEKDEKSAKDIERATFLADTEKSVALNSMGDISKAIEAFGGKNTAAFKALASMQVVVSTASAVMAALTPPPTGFGPVAGIFKGGVIAAMGAANIAKINGAKFHDGGLVPGAGEVPAVLQSGEFVINRAATTRAGIEQLQAINRGESAANVNVVNFVDTDQLDNYLSSRKGQKAVLNSLELE